MPVNLGTISQTEIPAVTLNKLFIDTFLFKQKKPNLRSVTVVGSKYGGEAGAEVYDDKVIEANVKDLNMAVATYSCQKRQITPDQFMIDYATALAQVDSDYKAGILTEAQIMAYMEIGMALMFEITGKLDIDGTGV